MCEMKGEGEGRRISVRWKRRGRRRKRGRISTR